MKKNFPHFNSECKTYFKQGGIYQTAISTRINDKLFFMV